MNKKEIIKYLITGVAATLTSWLTYAFFVQWFNITISNILSWIFAVIVAFILSKLWVFESKKQPKLVLFKEIGTFFAGRLFSGIVETVGLNLLCLTFLGNEVFGVKGLLAKVIMSCVSMVLNYIISKLIVFKHKTIKETLLFKFIIKIHRHLQNTMLKISQLKFRHLSLEETELIFKLKI